MCVLVSKILQEGDKKPKCYSSLKKNRNNHQKDFSKFDNYTNYLKT